MDSRHRTDTRSYHAFGQLLSSSGSTPTPFGYAGAWGYQEDVDSELKLLGHRYYDPATGRFLTRDPIKDGRNWYGYCENNPMGWIDPSGLWNMWKWIYTGDGNASDELYGIALDQAWDTMKKATGIYAQHLFANLGVEVPSTLPLIGPVPKAIAGPPLKWIGFRFPAALGGNTNLIRPLAQKIPELRPLANFVKAKNGAIWMVVIDVAAWKSTLDTWNDPGVWTFKDESAIGN